jgi:hypothetical protein
MSFIYRFIVSYYKNDQNILMISVWAAQHEIIIFDKSYV